MYMSLYMLCMYNMHYTYAAIFFYIFTLRFVNDLESLRYASMFTFPFMYSLTSENVIGIRAFSESLHSATVVTESDKFIERNFVSISQSEEFLQLGLAEMLNVLSRDGLNVDSEEQVLCSWIGSMLNLNIIYY